MSRFWQAGSSGLWPGFAQQAGESGPPNRIDNGGFSAGNDGWTLTGTADASSGALTGSGTASRNTNVTINSGEFFRLEFDLSGVDVSSTLDLSLGGGAAVNPPLANGPVTIYLLAGGADQALLLNFADLVIDNVDLTGPYTATAGAEIADDGGFDDPPGWTVTGTNASITDGAFVAAGGSGGKQATRAAAGTIEAGWHLVAFDLARTSGTGLVLVGGGGTSVSAAATGAVSGYAYSDATNQDIAAQATSNANLSIDNVSVKPLTFTLT